jgi:hypothetical protein
MIFFIPTIPLVLWAVLWHRLRGRVYEFDPAGHKFMFPVVWVPYRASFWAICVLSIAGALASIGLHVSVGLAFVFLVAAVCSLLFNLLTIVFYEAYLTAKYTMNGPMMSNYTAWKFALIQALGISSGLLFIVGILLGFLTIAGY